MWQKTNFDILNAKKTFTKQLTVCFNKNWKIIDKCQKACNNRITTQCFCDYLGGYYFILFYVRFRQKLWKGKRKIQMYLEEYFPLLVDQTRRKILGKIIFWMEKKNKLSNPHMKVKKSYLIFIETFLYDTVYVYIAYIYVHVYIYTRILYTMHRKNMESP